MRLAAAVLLALITVSRAAAQDQLTPQDFIDLAVGHTLTFDDFTDGSRVGIEQFLTPRRSVWARAGGACTYGDITLEGPYICFRYDDEPSVKHCWVPYSYEGKLLVRSAEGHVQEITRISEAPVQCEGAPVS